VDLSLHGGVLQTGFIKDCVMKFPIDLTSPLPAVELPLFYKDFHHQWTSRCMEEFFKQVYKSLSHETSHNLTSPSCMEELFKQVLKRLSHDISHNLTFFLPAVELLPHGGVLQTGI
jgi:hypothetical protein